MSLHHSPKIVTNGLVLCIDSANVKSYPGSGTTLFDISGNSITGTLVNGAIADSQGITLDGVNDYATITFNSLLNFTSSPFTISVWNKVITGGTGYNGIITSDDSGDDRWKIYKDIGTGYYRSRSGAVSVDFPAFTVGRFHNYAFTKIGTSLINYFDGNQSNSSSVATNPSSFSNNIALGSYRLNDAVVGYYLVNQTIGNIQIYNRALSATEIQQNFNAFRTRYGV